MSNRMMRNLILYIISINLFKLLVKVNGKKIFRIVLYFFYYILLRCFYLCIFNDKYFF